MQIKIKFQLNHPCRLPLHYNHYVQSMIYDLLSDNPEFSSHLHDTGYRFQDRTYKLFTFSQLRGPYLIEDKSICFKDWIELDIRSIDRKFQQILIEKLSSLKEVALGTNRLRIQKIEQSFVSISDSKIHIIMAAPMIVHITNQMKKTYFFSPWDKEFYERLSKNAKRKFITYYGNEPTGDLRITPVDISQRHKVVSKYKDFFITGWRGEYILEGDAALLHFLYQVGLGEKNAMGFGMFTLK